MKRITIIILLCLAALLPAGCSEPAQLPQEELIVVGIS